MGGAENPAISDTGLSITPQSPFRNAALTARAAREGVVNTQLLVHGIVQQTTVLIAQVATAGGIRAPLARVANQVFLDLTGELTAQGLGKHVIADMFGMALRTYHRKVRAVSESQTERGRSVWEAVLEHAATQVGIERLADIPGQRAALRFDPCNEVRVVRLYRWCFLPPRKGRKRW